MIIGSRAAICAVAVLSLSACAVEPPDSTADSGSLVCSREIPVGSNIPVRKCRTREQIEQERRTAEQVREAIRTGPSSSPKDVVGQ